MDPRQLAVGRVRDTRINEVERLPEEGLGLFEVPERLAVAGEAPGGDRDQPRLDEEVVVTDARGAEAKRPLELLPGGGPGGVVSITGSSPCLTAPAPLQALPLLRNHDTADITARQPIAAA